ncbi:unnamed protein product [Amoebophrya sp. A120]|nr:unnamed protein product [Amoebophrya sp. A120]|eukprot:GSA120T00022529001.1
MFPTAGFALQRDEQVFESNATVDNNKTDSGFAGFKYTSSTASQPQQPPQQQQQQIALATTTEEPVSLQLGLEKFKDAQYLSLSSGGRGEKTKSSSTFASSSTLRHTSWSSSGQPRSRDKIEQEVRQFEKVIDQAVLECSSTSSGTTDGKTKIIFTGGLESKEQLLALQRQVKLLLKELQQLGEAQRAIVEEQKGSANGSLAEKQQKKGTSSSSSAALKNDNNTDFSTDQKYDEVALQNAVERLNRKLKSGGGTKNYTSQNKDGSSDSTTTSNLAKIEIYCDKRDRTSTSLLKALEKKIASLEEKIFGVVNPQEEMVLAGGDESLHETLTRVSRTLKDLDTGRLDAIAESLRSLKKQKEAAIEGGENNTADPAGEVQRLSVIDNTNTRQMAKRSSLLFHQQAALTRAAEQQTVEEEQLEELYSLCENLFSVSSKKIPHFLARIETFKDFRENESRVIADLERVEGQQLDVRKKLETCKQALEALQGGLAENIAVMQKNFRKLGGG